jgi:hypothetical protein
MEFVAAAHPRIIAQPAAAAEPAADPDRWPARGRQPLMLQMARTRARSRDASAAKNLLRNGKSGEADYLKAHITTFGGILVSQSEVVARTR